MSTANQTIETLTSEHRIMERVLTLIRFQVCGLQPTSDPASFAFLANAIGYMHNYPGLGHHPAEELLFARLVASDPEAGKLCKHLAEQHEEFARRECAMLDCLRNAESGDPDACWHLEKLGCAYCAEHADHIGSEEAEAFPQAIRSLRTPDWAAIDRQAAQITDPLSDRDTLRRYENLYDYLMAADENFRFH